MVFPRGPVDTQTGIAGFLDEVARDISGGQLQIKRDDPDAAERFNAFISQAAQQFAQESGEPTESVFSQITGFLNRPVVSGPSIGNFLSAAGQRLGQLPFPGTDASRRFNQGVVSEFQERNPAIPDPALELIRRAEQSGADIAFGGGVVRGGSQLARAIGLPASEAAGRAAAQAPGAALRAGGRAAEAVGEAQPVGALADLGPAPRQVARGRPGAAPGDEAARLAREDAQLEAEVAAARAARSAEPPRQLTPDEQLEAEVAAVRQGGQPPQGPQPPGAAAGGQPQDPVQRVIGLIRTSKRLRPSIEEAISEQRKTGLDIGRERAAGVPTALARSRARLSGQAGQTTSQARFEPLARRAGDTVGDLSDVTPSEAAERLGVTGGDFETMFTQIERHFGDAEEFTGQEAQRGLIRLLTGNAATPAQARHLEAVFGREMAEAARSRVNLSGLRQAGGIALDVAFLLPKAVRSAYDMSAPLRQGVRYTLNFRPSRQRIVWSSLADMIKVGFAKPGEADKTALGIYKRITSPQQNRWATALYQTGPENSRLFLHNPEQPLLDFTKREEFFASDLAFKMPELGREFRSIRGRPVPGAVQTAVRVATLPVRLAGSGIRRSELMFGTYLNEVRDGVARHTLDQWAKAGKPITEEEVRFLRQGINVFTGRGILPDLGQTGNKLLSSAFWSPRLAAANVEAPFMPLIGVARSETRRAGRALAADLVAHYLTGASILALISATKLGTVELDPRSPNFGKVKIGPVTYDFWGGHQQIVRYAAQLFSNPGKAQRKTLSGRNAGKIEEVGVLQVLANFLRSKASPGAPTLLGNEIMGRTFEQEPLRQLSRERQTQIGRGQALSPNEIRLREAANQYAPLFAEQVREAVQDEGQRGIYQTLPEAFGVGVTVFDEEPAELAR